jgi:transposase-like protein
MKCPRCEKIDGQMKNGKNRSGTQSIMCRHCKKNYTPKPKQNAYSEEIRKQAIKTYYAGVSGRGVGKIFGMSKANVYKWIKKNGSKAEG